MASTLSKQLLGFCAYSILAVTLTADLSAQVGTRGSADKTGGGLILQPGGNDLTQPPAGFPAPADPFGFPAPTTPVQIQAVAPPVIETSNARGSVISFEQSGTAPPVIVGETSTTSTFGVNSPPVIATAPAGPTSGVITQLSPTEFIVRDFDGGIGEGLPIVDEAYATLDRGGVIETTRFGRPAGEITTGTTIAAGTVILSDGTVVDDTFRGNSTSGTTTSVARLAPAQRTAAPAFVGGVKPGVRVAIPRVKATPPRRTTNVASNSNRTTTTAPATTSIFVQQPVQPTAQPKTTISRTPKVTSTFVSGGALGLDTPEAAPKPAPTVAAVEPATTPAPAAAPAADPLKIRILFSADSIELQEQVKPALGQLASQLKSDPDMQIQLLSYASGADARRLSLTRALAVRANLIAQGIDSSRMIVKARGDKSDGGNADRLDIVEVN